MVTRLQPRKCKVMHIGHDLPIKYTMNTEDKGIQLEDITTEKDLGIRITRDLKPRVQCIQSAKKAQSVLGMVRRHFKEIDKDDFQIIYNTYVRPHLEYCEQAWSPHCRKTRHA